MSVNFNRFISAISRARKPSPIREATSLLLRSPPSMISLGGGQPNPDTFPFKTIHVETKDGSSFTLDGPETKKALQYSLSAGLPELIKWLEELQRHFHKPPTMENNHPAGFASCVTVGSQDGIAKIFDMLISAGDNVLIDDPCYSGTLAFLQPLPINLLPVETDRYGMSAACLRNVLSRWKVSDKNNADSDIPKVLYTIPNCGNPTGATASVERKREIYQLAQEYDLIIVEDDPYYFLQFDEDVAPSYQAMDTDGRVLRADSMSKVLSSGLRLGWVSGAKPFIDRLVLHQQATVLHTSTLSQVLAAKLLEKWGLDGFKKHVQEVRAFYKSQRDAIISSADKWLTGLAEWNVPSGGMFLWINLNGVDDTRELIQKRAVEKEVILIPGTCFSVKEGVKSSYCRASFSLSSKEDMDKGIQRLAELIREGQSAAR